MQNLEKPACSVLVLKYFFKEKNTNFNEIKYLNLKNKVLGLKSQLLVTCTSLVLQLSDFSTLKFSCIGGQVSSPKP